MHAASRSASVLAIAAVVVVASAGCAKDFDALFVDGGKGSSGDGTSGGSGGVFACDMDCVRECKTGASCEVKCIKGTCSLTCEAGSVCLCVGVGCDVTCLEGKPRVCGKGNAACGRECVE